MQRMPRAQHRVQWHDAPHGGGSATELLLFSPVKPGASGSPVLGGAGLVLGMVVERVAVDGRLSGTVALSRRGGSAPGRAPRGSRRCRWTASPVSCASRARSMRSATGPAGRHAGAGAARGDAVGRHYLRMRGERCEPPVRRLNGNRKIDMKQTVSGGASASSQSARPGRFARLRRAVATFMGWRCPARPPWPPSRPPYRSTGSAMRSCWATSSRPGWATTPIQRLCACTN